MFLNIIIELIFKLLLQINNASIIRNIPHVHLHEKRENKQHWHGAEIQVVILLNLLQTPDIFKQFHFPKYNVFISLS
jgi:hypothetical protein